MSRLELTKYAVEAYRHMIVTDNDDSIPIQDWIVAEKECREAMSQLAIAIRAEPLPHVVPVPEHMTNGGFISAIERMQKAAVPPEA